MFDQVTLRAINRDAAETAAVLHRTPFVPYDENEIRGWINHAPLPCIGDYCPPGWELVDTIFVDTTGCGAPDELANTREQFIEIALENYKRGAFGYAVTMQGEFQCYIGVFVPPTAKGRADQHPPFTDHK